jgi:hypothetical protein
LNKFCKIKNIKGVLMRSRKVVMLAIVFLVSLGVFSCGTEKDKVVKYLTKIKDYVNSPEYKAAGMSFVEASITTSPTGEKAFDENKLNESISGLIEKKDLEICSSVGFKDRQEAGALVTKYMAEADVKTVIEAIDKSMNDLAVEFQKEAMAKANITMPPSQMPPGHENIQMPPGHENLNMPTDKIEPNKTNDKKEEKKTDKK